MTSHLHIISKDSDALLVGSSANLTSSKLSGRRWEKNLKFQREWMLAYFRKKENPTVTIKLGGSRTTHTNRVRQCGCTEQKIGVLHENPVRAGFVEKAEDWVAAVPGRYYCGKKSLIELSYV
ncbi:MAG: hypothetical protein QM734_17470 [Cyclobacteriaceae bacterium]